MVNLVDHSIKYSQYNVALQFSKVFTCKYCKVMDKWYLWTKSKDHGGIQWIEDPKDIVVTEFREFLTTISRKASRDIDLTPSKQVSTQILIESSAYIKGALSELKTIKSVSTCPVEWDSNLWELNTPKGIVDLTTGFLRERTKDDLGLLYTLVSPLNEPPVKWLEFLNQACNGDAEMIGFLKRIAGFALTGITTPHSLFFLHGCGGNGKGTFILAIQTILNSYACSVKPRMFIETQQETHLSEYAVLMSKRLILCEEIKPDARWDKEKMNSITGGNNITANFMRQDYFTFRPRFKVLLAANDKPEFKNPDNSVVRRLHLIPFNHTPKKENHNLERQLEAEYPKILSWMIEGCLEFQEVGLNPPDWISQATKQYIADEDQIQQWIDSRTKSVGNDGGGQSSRMYESWKMFCKESGIESGSQISFSKKMFKKGFKVKNTSNFKRWIGIDLTDGEMDKIYELERKQSRGF